MPASWSKSRRQTIQALQPSFVATRTVYLETWDLTTSLQTYHCCVCTCVTNPSLLLVSSLSIPSRHCSLTTIWLVWSADWFSLHSVVIEYGNQDIATCLDACIIARVRPSLPICAEMCAMYQTVRAKSLGLVHALLQGWVKSSHVNLGLWSRSCRNYTSGCWFNQARSHFCFSCIEIPLTTQHYLSEGL